MRLVYSLSPAFCLVLASCSFTTATGFEECMSDSDCSKASACLSRYCIKLPDGCTRVAGDFKDDDRIPFAAVLPLTTDSSGARDESEYAGLNAFTQALDEMNQRMGANGRNFALHVCDTQRDETRASDQAKWMAEQLKVPVVLSSGSGQTINISFATREFGTLVMSATATSPELISEFVSSGALLWRTAPPDTLQSRVLANLLLNDAAYQAATTIGIIYVNDPYGQGLEAELADRLRRAGRTVIAAPFTSGMDVTQAVSTVANGPAQATVLIAVTSDAKRVLSTAFLRAPLKKAAGHRWAFADASKDLDLLTVPGAITELAGALGTAPAQGAGAAFPTFRDAYRTQFGIDPSNYSFTSHSYDAMYLLGLAASYASASDRTLSGRTMADAFGLFSSGAAYTLEPRSFSDARRFITQGTSINVEGSSGKLDFIPDAGAPLSLMEVWRVEGDGGGFFTVGNFDPPVN